VSFKPIPFHFALGLSHFGVFCGDCPFLILCLLFFFFFDLCVKNIQALLVSALAFHFVLPGAKATRKRNIKITPIEPLHRSQPAQTQREREREIQVNSPIHATRAHTHTCMHKSRKLWYSFYQWFLMWPIMRWNVVDISKFINQTLRHWEIHIGVRERMWMWMCARMLCCADWGVLCRISVLLKIRLRWRW